MGSRRRHGGAAREVYRRGNMNDRPNVLARVWRAVTGFVAALFGPDDIGSRARAAKRVEQAKAHPQQGQMRGMGPGGDGGW